MKKILLFSVFSLALGSVTAPVALTAEVVADAAQGAMPSTPGPMSEAEANKKLKAMFDSSHDDGPRPKAPGLAELGVSATHLDAIWFDAARGGRTDLLSGLVHRGFDPNRADAKGYTAVILAAYNNHLATVKALVEQGAKPCGEDRKGNTALMGAAFKGESDILRYLASQGCPVDTQNKAGQTALMMAALFGRTETVHTLLDLGANPALRDTSGATAITLASVQNNTDIVKLLQKALKTSLPQTKPR